jgi:hypothetical protein
MPVEPADLDFGILGHGFEVHAGHGLHGVLVGHAEDDAVDELLQEIARPVDDPVLGKGGEFLEPALFAHGQLVAAVALGDEQVLGGRVEFEVDFPGRQFAHQLEKAAALDPGQAFGGHFGWVVAGEFQAGIRGHDPQVPVRGLKPDSAQKGGPGLGRNDVGRFLQPVDDVVAVHRHLHGDLLWRYVGGPDMAVNAAPVRLALFF